MRAWRWWAGILGVVVLWFGLEAATARSAARAGSGSAAVSDHRGARAWQPLDAGAGLSPADGLVGQSSGASAAQLRFRTPLRAALREAGARGDRRVLSALVGSILAEIGRHPADATQLTELLTEPGVLDLGHAGQVEGLVLRARGDPVRASLAARLLAALWRAERAAGNRPVAELDARALLHREAPHAARRWAAQEYLVGGHGGRYRADTLRRLVRGVRCADLRYLAWAIRGAVAVEIRAAAEHARRLGCPPLPGSPGPETFFPWWPGRVPQVENPPAPMNSAKG